MKLNLPTVIPIFPLNGVIYFPETNLPLNIFEPRYLSLINDCMKSNKYIGMIQSKKNTLGDVYSIGCLGRITQNKKTKDGRLLINLIGITRFEIKIEINNDKTYREFEVTYDKFKDDLGTVGTLGTQTRGLNKIKEVSEKTKIFFKKNGLLLNWKEFEKLDENQRINTLAMIAPISDEEKQTILESVSAQSKIKVLSQIIDFYMHKSSFENSSIQ
jgi:Lon protease-like protein